MALLTLSMETLRLLAMPELVQGGSYTDQISRWLLGLGIIVSTGLSGAAQSFNQQLPGTPAETLIEPAILRAIAEAPNVASPAIEMILGVDASAGEVLTSCHSTNAATNGCTVTSQIARSLRELIDARQLAPPARTMRQRPSADALNIVVQGIEREQRRIRSFAAFMPSPIDPTLQSRLNDMEKGVTGVWATLGLTSAPYTPRAQRIRGGEDRRVSSRSTDAKDTARSHADT